MTRQYGFEKLMVWPNSRKLVRDIYCLTKALPTDEMNGLVNQIQLAAISVSSNIAEGSSRTSGKDQGHFYQTAYASLMDVLCQLILCFDLTYLSEHDYHSPRESIDQISYQLNHRRSAALSKLPQLSKPSHPSKPKN